MRALTESMLEQLGRLRLWQKLALLVGAMLVPAVLLGCFYFGEATSAIAQARQELSGAGYLKSLGRVAGEILTHRDRAFAVLIGDKAREGDLQAQTLEVDAQIAAADPLDAQVGARLGVSDNWRAIKAEWLELKSKTLQHSPDEDDAAHILLASHLAQLAEQVSARSMTSFDPGQETRTLVRVAADVAPAVLSAAGEMRRHAVRTAAKGYLGGDDRMGIRIFRDRQVALLDSLEDALGQLSPGARAILQPTVRSARSASDAFHGVIQSKILGAANIQASAGEIYDAGIAPTRELKSLSLVAYDLLNTRLAERLSQLRERQAVSGAITAVALGLALWLAWLMNQSLSRRLRQAIDVFDRIACGEYDNALETRGQDEASQVMHALKEMQARLRAQIERERTVAAENLRIRQALDIASTSVVLADSGHEIIYVNQTAQATFASGESEIRKTLRQFAAQGLKGARLESLATDPARERHTLDTLNGSDTQERALGALTFRTVSSPVVAENGERMGTVMEWTDRTQEVGTEKQMQSMLAAVLQGDLQRRIPLEGMSGFFAAASRKVNQLADNLAEIVSLVKESAGEIYRGAKEISSGNTNLQTRTEEQASSLEQTASSMEEMMTTVKRNAENAGQANQLAVAARGQAEQGGAVVGKAVSAMSGINESARRIAAIIGVIDEIAFQTNLLALNAAVEAARAGEQGRGFAVVATEVRTLAGRSATAARQIKELIQDSVRKVEDGSLLVTQSGQTLEQIVTSVKKVSDIVAEIAAASREQSSGIGQVNQAVVQMDDLTQQNAALVEQITTASLAMAQQAHALHEMMGGYRLGERAQAAGVRVVAPSAMPVAGIAGSRAEPGSSAAATGREVPAPSASRPSVRAAGGGEDSAFQDF
ncbi:MAG TPA: methyl-accepting chemotaxis protein [Steroidobacteraceae bacterium]|nr:methyl-accepting chemotaxis protein [Steroidobacteraceae bacterium]